jgi:hypothetical protein
MSKDRIDRHVEFRLGSVAALTKVLPGAADERDLAVLVEHTVNQTLQRDLFAGAWAQAWVEDDSVVVSIVSPADDLSPYLTKLPAFVEAAMVGFAEYDVGPQELRLPISSLANVRLMFPFGLALARPRSVHFLHFPPSESSQFVDYLYDPTTRRWEEMLILNGADPFATSLIERIVDLVPLAAGGGDAADIRPFDGYFSGYVSAMLRVTLSRTALGVTQPVVAGGGPVMAWLTAQFGREVSEQVGSDQLQVLDLVVLPLLGADCPSPVLCSNHPSKYCFMLDDPTTTIAEKISVMRQDLIASAWQVRMAADWSLDPSAVLAEVSRYWDEHPRLVEEQVELHDAMFGSKPSPAPPITAAPVHHLVEPTPQHP